MCDEKRELTPAQYEVLIEAYEKIVGDLVDRINGIDRDYSPQDVMTVDKIDRAFSDRPHWQWHSDYDDSKDYGAGKPDRIPQEGEWRFRVGGVVEMMRDQFEQESPFGEYLKERGAIKRP